MAKSAGVACSEELSKVAVYNEVIAPLPYFGNVGFYARLLQDDLLIDLHENYVKQSLRNRCELVSSQGRFSLTVPVHRPSGVKVKMRDIRISYDEDWRAQHRKSVRSAYGSSPFFLYYWDEISALWDEQPERLAAFNESVHDLLCSLIGIAAPLRYSDDYIGSSPGLDLRPTAKTGQIDNPRYIQVWEEEVGFEPDLSILDLLFCKGPEVEGYLQSMKL